MCPEVIDECQISRGYLCVKIDMARLFVVEIRSVEWSDSECLHIVPKTDQPGSDGLPMAELTIACRYNATAALFEACREQDMKQEVGGRCKSVCDNKKLSGCERQL